MRIWPGQLSVMHKTPSVAVSVCTLAVAGSSTSGLMPKKGLVADPGFCGIAPGMGVMICPPVSVCQNVSTIGQRPLPTWVLYQDQASGLIGSPTDPSSFKDDRSCLSTHSGPRPIRLRIAVGAV